MERASAELRVHPVQREGETREGAKRGGVCGAEERRGWKKEATKKKTVE